jgi:hypothetical protein
LTRLFNPWFLLAILLLAGGAFAYGAKVGADFARGKAAETAALIEGVEERAQNGAAKAIATIKPVNRYSKEVLTREIQTVPDYSRCHLSPDGVRALDALLENRPIAAGDSVLPADSRQAR